MAAKFPGVIVDFDPNENGLTAIDGAYMTERDEEIVAVEKSLGADLVENVTDPLTNYAKVVDGHLSLGHVAGKRVRVGDGDLTEQPSVPLEVIADDASLMLSDTSANGTNYRLQSEGGSFHLIRHTDGDPGASYRVMVAEESTSRDSIYIDDVGNVGIGINGAPGGPTASLDINGDTIRLRTIWQAAPTGTDGKIGDIRLVAIGSAHYIYVKMASATWKSVELT